MKDRKATGLPVVGVSALLTIFAVLCLTVFALLSVATVRADLRLAEAARQAVTDYYAADSRAQRILAQLRRGGIIEGVEQEGDTFHFSCPVGQNQQLDVQVVLNGTDYEIVQWQVRPCEEWTGDESLPVWSGEKEE